MYNNKSLGLAIQEINEELISLSCYCVKQIDNGNEEYEAVYQALRDARTFIARARDNAFKIEAEKLRPAI